MPWEQVTVMKKREEFVLLARQEGANISHLCRSFGISRKTGYKWLNRYASGQADPFDDHSRRPHQSPRKSLTSTEDAVLEVRQRHPAWDGRKIAYVLWRDRQYQVAPSTVTKL